MPTSGTGIYGASHCRAYGAKQVGMAVGRTNSPHKRPDFKAPRTSIS